MQNAYYDLQNEAGIMSPTSHWDVNGKKETDGKRRSSYRVIEIIDSQRITFK